MTKKEFDTVMNGVSDMLNNTATKMSEAVIIAMDKSETALIEKITALENRLTAAEKRINNTVPAGTPSTGNTYTF